MAQTTSLSFPQMFDPARNVTGVLDDNAAIANRVRLLLLTEPTELFNEPDQGGGLRRFLWQYNNTATRSRIHEHIIKQLRLHEPCVDPDGTTFADGLLLTEGSEKDYHQSFQTLKMTVGLRTKFGDSIPVEAEARPSGQNSAEMPGGIYDGITSV